MNYALCLNNQGYEASLTVGAIYKVLLKDSDQGSLRVIDNEGEDYLYDAGRFQLLQFDDLLPLIKKVRDPFRP